MRLKEYQERALDSFGGFLSALATNRAAHEQARVALQQANVAVNLPDPLLQTWETTRPGNVDWHPLKDGTGLSIPHVCFKVPTGGGKTLLAAHAVERFFVDHEQRRTGLVLWITPSDAIFQQTWGQLRNRAHPYRQVLDRAAAGRVKIVQKLDRLTPLDLQSHLCVMVMMLQSAARETKDTLKVFADSGNYAPFFPSDDVKAAEALLKAVPNLETHDLADALGPVTGASIKTSLGNVLRLVRPMIVIDEGHRAYSDIARNTMAGLNPRFMLELSATPKAARSNILVSVSGRALKEEEMIKLPIELRNITNGDWKDTLTAAWEQTRQLQAAADAVHDNTGRYIRPIMLVRVERTGKDQRGGGFVHSEEVREFLVTRLGLPPEAIRVQTADVKELNGEDLLSEYSPVRAIITKDALREGWDCPFAYVLAILSQTTADTALTQMIGRVLRQPHAQATGVAALDSAWVYCFEQRVSDAVENIKKGLQSEGLEDVAEYVSSGGRADDARPEVVRRRAAHRGREILLPRVRHREGKAWRELDYDRDVLSELPWEGLSYRNAQSVSLDGLERAMMARAQVDISADLLGHDHIDAAIGDADALDQQGLDRPYLIRQLLDVVPNPWQGARILDEALGAIRARGVDESLLIRTRMALIGAIKRDLQAQVEAHAEDLFRQKVKDGEIAFRLMGQGAPSDDWQVPHEITVTRTSTSKKLTRDDGQPVQLSLFDPIYEDGFNGFERDVALYLDQTDAVRWWHRVAARADWGLQGWMRRKVYPDFLCWFELQDGVARLMALESKGRHLENAADTEWKRRLFGILEDLYRHGMDCGEVQLEDHAKHMRFRILLSSEDAPQAWRTDLAAAFA